jgi:hypothetical protein
MKHHLALALLLLSAACNGASGSAGDPNNPNNDNGTPPQLYALTINNQVSWCSITATLDGNQLVQFSDESATLSAPSGAKIALDAQPLPGFLEAQWTGTATETNPTSYVMTSDPNQSVTAFCPAN